MHDLKSDDILSCFIFRRSRLINYERSVVNTAVFTEKHHNGFLVFCILSLVDDQIWQMARETVAVNPEQPLLGRCDFMTKYYLDAELIIDKSKPHTRHLNRCENANSKL